MKKRKWSIIVFYLLFSQTKILYSQDILAIPDVPDNKKICFALYTVHEKTNEIIYSLRIKGHEFIPKVFAKGSYTIIVEKGTIKKYIRAINQ